MNPREVFVLGVMLLFLLGGLGMMWLGIFTMREIERSVNLAMFTGIAVSALCGLWEWRKGGSAIDGWVMAVLGMSLTVIGLYLPKSITTGEDHFIILFAAVIFGLLVFAFLSPKKFLNTSLRKNAQ